MNFFDLTGQQTIISSLRQIIENKTIAHAYLFVGFHGMGKKTIAGIFAQAILCTSDVNKPCGNCLNCRQFASGNHPDVVTLKQQKASIGIDEVRAIQLEFNRRPYQADRKIIFIEDAQLLTFQAQNALLKSLEEPHQFVVVILLSQRLQGLLPTVISRLKVFRLERLSREEVAGIIIRRTDTTPEKAELCAALAEGNPGMGINLAVSSEITIQREEVFGFLRNVDAKASEFLGDESFFTSKKSNLEFIFEVLTSWFRDCIVFKETRSFEHIINVDMRDLLETQAETLSVKDAADIIEIIEKSKKMLKSNVNSQLVVKNVLFEILGRFENGRSRS